MKQLERLLLFQHYKCFFCNHPIPKGQASVEHLDPLSKGGKKSDDNSVACCKTLNIALGSLPLREKFRIILGHKGASGCLAATLPKPDAKPRNTHVTEAQKLLPEVVNNLRKQGTAKPKTSSTLRKSLRNSFKKASPKIINAVMVLLKSKGYTADNDGEVTYPGL
jgi:hypothetical protein